MPIVVNDPNIAPASWKCAQNYAFRVQVGTGVVNPNDYAVQIDASGAASTITLPSAAANPGRKLLLKKKDSSANAVTIAPSGSDTAELTSLATQNKYVVLMSDGISNWAVFGNN